MAHAVLSHMSADGWCRDKRVVMTNLLYYTVPSLTIMQVRFALAQLGSGCRTPVQVQVQVQVQVCFTSVDGQVQPLDAA
jgi:porphobilinogen deaminase